jgi:hypothetical protein
VSAIAGSCSESAAQTLFNKRIAELQQPKRQEEKEPLTQPGSSQELKADQTNFESSVATRKAVEPGKGQLLDLYV